MKKLFFTLIAAIACSMTLNAQSAIELAKQQRELNETIMKMLNAKPSKSAKKQAKEYKKEGWTVNAGDKDMEQQITASQMYGEEPMVDEDGNTTKRFIMQSGTQTAGSYNAGYAAARNQAQVELAAMIKTQIVAAMQGKLDNAQASSISATTVDKFNERTKSIVDEALTNSIPVLTIYRRLPNNLFEVQVRLAFDKKELTARLKRNMQKQLEEEGDELSDIVDDVLRNKL